MLAGAGRSIRSEQNKGELSMGCDIHLFVEKRTDEKKW
jgi:hypothetical protein